jgi:hypothetical protein
MMYFAKDGSYGDASEMVIVSVDDWSEEHLNDIEDTPDDHRLAIAIQTIVHYNTSHYQVGKATAQWFTMQQ